MKCFFGHLVKNREIFTNAAVTHISDRGSDHHVLCFFVALALAFHSHPVTSMSVEKPPIDKFWKKGEMLLENEKFMKIDIFSTLSIEIATSTFYVFL